MEKEVAQLMQQMEDLRRRTEKLEGFDPSEIAKLRAQYTDVERRVGKVEALGEYQQKDMQRLLESQATTKAQVEQIISKIDKLETNLMAPIRSIAEVLNNPSSRINRSNEEGDKQRMWMDLFKWTIGGTIVAIVVWMVAQSL